MINIICDCCGKLIAQPIRDVNYFNLQGKEVCAPCNLKLKQLAEKDSSTPDLSFMTYKKALTSTLRKNCK